MAIVLAKCTNCGNILNVDSTNEAAICPHCSAAFIVEKAINNYNVIQSENNIPMATPSTVVHQQMNTKQTKNSKYLTIIITILVVAILAVGGFFIYDHFFNKGDLNGRYVSESGLYTVSFKDDYTCVWYQDVHGNQVFFDGIYEKDGDKYVLRVDGEVYAYSTEFIAVPVKDGLIITGGLVNGELFEKQ